MENGEAYIWDAKHSLEFNQVARTPGLSCCISATSTPILMESTAAASRFVYGVECLQVQGFMASDLPAAMSFNNAEHMDLAGNAFSAGAVCASALATLVVFSDYLPADWEEHQRRKAFAKATMAPCMLDEMFDNIFGSETEPDGADVAEPAE